MQILKPKTHFLRMGRMLINERLHTVGPVNCGALISHLGRALASSWFKGHENLSRSIALLCCIIPERLPRLGWERSTDFSKQLGRRCIHAHLRTLGIIRFFRDISRFFHMENVSGSGGHPTNLTGRAPSGTVCID